MGREWSLKLPSPLRPRPYIQPLSSRKLCRVFGAGDSGGSTVRRFGFGESDMYIWSREESEDGSFFGARYIDRGGLAAVMPVVCGERGRREVGSGRESIYSGSGRGEWDMLIHSLHSLWEPCSVTHLPIRKDIPRQRRPNWFVAYSLELTMQVP